MLRAKIATFAPVGVAAAISSAILIDLSHGKRHRNRSERIGMTSSLTDETANKLFALRSAIKSD